MMCGKFIFILCIAAGVISEELIRSLIDGELEKVSEILRNGGEVNSVGDMDRTALHEAARTCSVEITNILLEYAKLHLDAADAEGKTALHLAVENKCLSVVNVLLEAGANPKAVDYYGMPVLHTAVNIESTEIVRTLLAREEIEITDRDAFGNTALHVAAATNEGDVLIKFFIAESVDADDVNLDGETAAHFVAKNEACNVEGADAIFAVTKNIDNTDMKGYSPLHLVKCVGVMEKLLQRKANPNLKDPSGDFPIHSAAGNGDEGKMNLLTSFGADLNAVNEDGNTVLHVAARHHISDTSTEALFVRVVESLIANGCLTDTRDEKGNIPLHVAIQHDNEKVASVLADHTKDLNALNGYGHAAIHLAIIYGSRIVEKLASLKADLNIRDCEDNNAPIHYATQYALGVDAENVSLLVNEGVDVDAINKSNQHPLHLMAGFCDKYEIAAKIVAVAEKADHMDDNDVAPIHLAITNGCVRMAEILSGKSDATTVPEQDTPLHMVIRNGEAAMILALAPIRKRDTRKKNKFGDTPLHLIATNCDMHEYARDVISDVNDKNGTGLTALHIAVRSRCYEMTKVLTEAKANVNLDDKEGWTALHLALRSDSGESYKIVKLLLENEADVHLYNPLGDNAFQYAVRNGNVAAAKILMTTPKDANRRNAWRDTPIHLAVQAGSLELVKFLKELGAKIKARNKDKSTALHIAAQGKDCQETEEIIEYLIRNGADIGARNADGETACMLAVDHSNKNLVKKFIAIQEELQEKQYGGSQSPNGSQPPPVGSQPPVVNVYNIYCSIM